MQNRTAEIEEATISQRTSSSRSPKDLDQDAVPPSSTPPRLPVIASRRPSTEQAIEVRQPLAELADLLAERLALADMARNTGNPIRVQFTRCPPGSMLA